MTHRNYTLAKSLHVFDSSKPIMTNTRIYKMYCAGEFIESDTPLLVTNPFDQSLVAQTWYASESDLNSAIIAAAEVAESMQNLSSHLKYSILMQISDDLLSLRQQFASLLSLESGKPIRFALVEVDRSIQTFRVAAEESRRIPTEYISLDWTQTGEGKEGLVKYFPAGIVAGISPFNFPLNLAVHKIAPAIAAGCPIILKPSSLTPLSTLLLAQVIHKTKLPKGAVSVLPMDRQKGNLLVTDPRIAVLSFTGSPEVGWKMKNNAGKKKVILELGGNAGVIISSKDDIEQIVSKCISGAFSYSGQVCIHTQRIFVLQNIFQEFIDLFSKKISTLIAGNPIDSMTDISVMIDEDNAIRVETWIADAVAGGATLVCGGNRKGNYVEPALLTGTHPEMQVCADEIFGPVVVVEPVNTFSEAIELINSGRFGLQAGVFTNNISEMNQAFNRLKVGGVIINDIPTFRVDHMPYGGVKDSGTGREGVKYAMLDMMEPRLLVKNSLK